MAKVNLALLLALCLSLNLANNIASANPIFDDDDDWSKSEESQEDPKPVEETPRSLGGGHDTHADHSGHEGHKSSPEEKATILGAGIGGGGASPSQFGGNVAGFNESCGGTSARICNQNTNLICQSNRCICKNEHVYISGQEKCHPIAKNDGDCEFNDQCHAGKWGQHSRCERTTGRCQCYDNQQFGKRETIFVDNTCYIKRAYNDVCDVDAECSGMSLAPNTAYCAPLDPSAPPHWINATQVCQCKPGHVWHNPIQICARLADGLGSECKLDLQCQFSSLGNLSRCGLESAKCECWDPAKPGLEFATYYKPLKTCFQRKDWNDTCTRHEECKASISSQAECLESREENQQQEGGGWNEPKKTCQCPTGKTCPRDVDDGDSALELGSATAMNLAILAVTVLVMGRRG